MVKSFLCSYNNIVFVKGINIFKSAYQFVIQFGKVNDSGLAQCKINNTQFFLTDKPDIPGGIFFEIPDILFVKDVFKIRGNLKGIFLLVVFVQAIFSSNNNPVFYFEYIIVIG